MHYKFIASSATEVKKNSEVRRTHPRHSSTKQKQDVGVQGYYSEEARGFVGADSTVNPDDFTHYGRRQRKLLVVRTQDTSRPARCPIKVQEVRPQVRRRRTPAVDRFEARHQRDMDTEQC